MDVDILSLFPEYFSGPFDESIIKRARERKFINIRHTNIRDFAVSKDRRVDDRAFGGGPGMVMMAGPVSDAIKNVRRNTSHVIYLSPQGSVLTAQKCRELARFEHLILLCGHYEGIDERALELVNEEISIGDYVLTNGALASIVLVDAVSRFVPGVIGDERAAALDSFENGILDHPHYTHPVVFEGKEVPKVLLSGHHKEIAAWRRKRALKKTAEKRPDLMISYLAAKNCEVILGKSQIKPTLVVADVKKSASFYRKVLGFTISDETCERISFNEGVVLVEGIPQKGNGVLTLQVSDAEVFEKIAIKLKQVGKLQTKKGEMKEIPFTDHDDYPWVLLISSGKEMKNEQTD